MLGKGAPLDVPLNSWIDVRLSMPAPPEVQARDSMNSPHSAGFLLG